MRFWIGITDNEWFEFLRARQLQEVNFWQPSGRIPTRALAPGIPFLFKLHSPANFIVGGGFVVRFSVLPAWLAWTAFGEANGVGSYEGLRTRLAKYRRAVPKTDPEIGCSVLNDPFFFERDEWIKVPEDFKPNTQVGKTYDTENPIGARLWSAVRERLASTAAREELAIEDEARGGRRYLALARLGQGSFRVLVTDAYRRRCAISGERTLPVLQAAHILPYAEKGPNVVSNGMLLRSDLHTLFDQGYLTLDPDLRVLVSRRIKEEYENGREYYRFHGHELAPPPDPSDRPSPAFLNWHRTERFKE